MGPQEESLETVREECPFGVGKGIPRMREADRIGADENADRAEAI
jgi:hypothetical protein